MASTDKPGSTAERPLWVIALALLTIAFCLLFFVIQTFLDNPPDRQAARPTLPRRRITSDDHPTRPLPPAYPARAIAPAQPAPVVAPEPVPMADPPPPPAPALPAPAPKPAVAGAGPGGYAPLSYLGQTNYHTAFIGKVRLQGTPPAEQPLDLSSSSYCLSVQPKPPTTRSFVVGSDGGLADVLVYIREGLPKRRWPAAQAPCMLQFTNCQIQPYVSAGLQDQLLQVANRDGVAHKLRITPVQGREVVSQLNYDDPVGLVLPARAELFIPCRCDMHPWETAYISVLDNPFFAVTGPDGKFAISNVPPGTYVLEAFHRKAHGTNGISKQFTLTAGKTITANFTIEAPPSRLSTSF
jgi:hypothetical protein